METKKHDLGEVRKQLEYYLGDENLKTDEFFHNLIANLKKSSKSVTLDVFMKCNKIKKMDIEPQVLIEAAKDSTILEPNATSTAIRRKGDFHLPDLEPKLQKKVKKEGENGTKNQLEEKKADDNVFDPVIVKVTVENASSKTWKDIQQHLKDKVGIEIPYARFNKVEGHFAVDKKLFSDSLLKDLEGGFELDGEKFSVAKCEGEDLRSFYDLHGYHFQNIVESSTKKKVDLSDKKKKGRNDSKGRRQSKQTKSVTLGKHTFDNIEKIKNTIKSLLQSTADNEEIKESNHSLLHDLLKHHDNYETKVKDIKHFTAGPHPSYTETRCFFVVRNNGEKEDFSTTKCYNKLEKIIEGEDE